MTININQFNTEDRKKIFLPIIAWIGIILAILYFYSTWKNNIQKQRTQNGSIKELSVKKIPPNFPFGIVVDDKAYIVHSYTGFTSSGKEQSTLVYYTIKPVKKIIEEYIAYFKSKNWNVEQKDISLTSIEASLTNSVINITVFSDQYSSQSTVTINMLTQPGIHSR